MCVSEAYIVHKHIAPTELQYQFVLFIYKHFAPSELLRQAI